MRETISKYFTMKTIGIIGIISILIIFAGVALGSNKNTRSANTMAQEDVIIDTENLEEAYFAGGCFWCMESIFESQPGVEGAYVGYTGGDEATATYELTSAGDTDHREGVRVSYDPDIITYNKLVELFWTQIDPTDDGGQFNDRGFVYTTAIYYNNEEEKQIAEQSKANLGTSMRFDEPIVTQILPAQPFYDAEDYHQNYYKENSIRYKLYTSGSGRKEFIEENWQDRIEELEGKDFVDGELTQKQNDGTTMYSEQELREMLTPIQYEVTQEMGTEPAFDNAYWDNKEDGIYVDVIDGTPLYSSKDKFDSGTGWPSFTKSIDESNLKITTDTRFFMTRTKVDSATSGAHLGHIFEDAPEELGGIRHCINSASLRFVPADELEAQGYGEYVSMFETQQDSENQSKEPEAPETSTSAPVTEESEVSQNTETEMTNESQETQEIIEYLEVSTSNNASVFVMPARNGQVELSESELKSMLTKTQYAVAIESKTETAFNNPLWDNKQAGIYVDIVDGTPLYSSRDKYVSGTGWPTFVKPIISANVTEHEDNVLFIQRTEIKSATSGIHLGHVFDDGPEDRGGLRYCMNSAAMRFVPLEDMQSEGYGDYIQYVQ